MSAWASEVPIGFGRRNDSDVDLRLRHAEVARRFLAADSSDVTILMARRRVFLFLHSESFEIHGARGRHHDLGRASQRLWRLDSF